MSSTTASTSAAALTPASSIVNQAFTFPPHHSFPPFYTLQPNLTTRASQLSSWSSLLLAYCAHNRLFRLSTSHPVFHNESLNRRLAPEDARVVFEHMIQSGRAEYVSAASPSAAKSSWYGGGGGGEDATATAKEEVYVYWRTPEEWYTEISDWVDGTGQKNTVLTVWELVEGEAAAGRAWDGMPGEMFRRCLAVGVKRGKTVLFGEEEGLGVKFV